MKFCTKCGTQLQDKDNYCTKCGCAASQNQTPLENKVTNESFEFNPQNSQRPPKKPFSTKIIAIISIIGIAIVFGIIAITAPCKHEWSQATCTEPKTCKICQATEGSAKGHTEGDWITTKKATLTNKGEETLSCSVCDELLDSRSIQKKLPKVEDDYFNFTDKELIDWINDKSTASVSSSDLGIFEETNSNTSYRITGSDGETGALLLNHGDNGKKGNIQAIMVYSSEDSFAGALGVWIANKIDSDFDTNDAFYKLVYNKSYTAANMTITKLELEDDFEVYLLAPSEYIADLLS